MNCRLHDLADIYFLTVPFDCFCCQDSCSGYNNVDVLKYEFCFFLMVELQEAPNCEVTELMQEALADIHVRKI